MEGLIIFIWSISFLRLLKTTPFNTVSSCENDLRVDDRSSTLHEFRVVFIRCMVLPQNSHHPRELPIASLIVHVSGDLEDYPFSMAGTTTRWIRLWRRWKRIQLVRWNGAALFQVMRTFWLIDPELLENKLVIIYRLQTLI